MADEQPQEQKRISKWNPEYRLVWTYPEIDNGEYKKDTKTKEDIVKAIEIRSPLACEFSIKRASYSGSNTASFKLYNLAAATRAVIFHDRYNTKRICFVDFFAGFGGQQSCIFKGKALTAYSKKVGANIITEIQALDVDIGQSYTNKVYTAGMTYKDIIKDLVANMPNTQLGVIGDIQGTLKNDFLLQDLSFNAINKITGDQSFIDNGILNTLKNNEVLGDVGIYEITSATGLLDTPVRQDAQLSLHLVLSPEITVGQLVDVKSAVAPDQFNGQYKVIGLVHQGVIGEGTNGQVTTDLNVLVGAQLPNSNWLNVKNANPNTTQENIQTGKVYAVKGEDLKIVGDSAKNVKAVYEYIVKNKAVPNWTIIGSIKWSDVILWYDKINPQYGTKQYPDIPTIGELTNLATMAAGLHLFCKKNYGNRSFYITSGWRSARYNRSVGGASDSYHISGKALDFKINNTVNSQVKNKVLALGGVIGGGDTYNNPEKGNFVHVALRGGVIKATSDV